MSLTEFNDEELENWLKKINQEFYDLVYDDLWLGQIFKHIPKEFIVSQQIDFMLGALGGPKRYSGRSPKDAHPHIFVTEEMWEVRESLLKQAFEKTFTPQSIRDKWLKIDEAFKASIIMKSPSECTPRYASDEFIIIPNPFKKSA